MGIEEYLKQVIIDRRDKLAYLRQLETELNYI